MLFWNSLLRFCGCLTEREMEYSMIFIVPNAHHTCEGKIGVVMISYIFQASLGKSFFLFGALWGTLSEVFFVLPLLRGTG